MLNKIVIQSGGLLHAGVIPDISELSPTALFVLWSGEHYNSKKMGVVNYRTLVRSNEEFVIHLQYGKESWDFGLKADGTLIDKYYVEGVMQNGVP